MNALLLCALLAPGAPRAYTITMTAPAHDVAWAPMHVTVPAAPGFHPVLRRRGRVVASQTRTVPDGQEVTWIAEGLPAGKTERLELRIERGVPRAAAPGDWTAVARGADTVITCGGKPVATYDATTGPNKPYLHPLFGPDGQRMVRRFPLERVAGETNDHPHHRGLWFTHGDLNGQDYWSEGKNAASTRQRAAEQLAAGPLSAYLRTATDWVSREGKRSATDIREIRFYRRSDAIVIDFEVELRASDGEIRLGDTKEGSFGLRLPDTMRLTGGDGHILNSDGVADGKTWGRAANWVDYTGTVEGKRAGVAILCGPGSFRAPTTWHVRDYGLFAANPFGLHDFDPKLPRGAGDHTLAAGSAMRFAYRVILHRDGPEDAAIARGWADYAAPPTAVVTAR